MLRCVVEERFPKNVRLDLATPQAAPQTMHLRVILGAATVAACVARRVDEHTAYFSSAPPNGGVSNLYPTGPITCNGNIGVSAGSINGSIELYMTVHGMWIIGSDTAPRAFSPSGSPVFTPAGAGASISNSDPYLTPAGGLIGGLTLSSPSLHACTSLTWTAAQYLSNATVRVNVACPDSGAAVSLTALAAATEQLVLLQVANTGTVPLPLDMTLWTNGNVLQLPVSAGATAGANDTWPQHTWVRKLSGDLDCIVFPITGVLMTTTVSPLLPATTVAVNTTVTVKSWVNGSMVNTTTVGMQSSTVLQVSSAPLVMAVAAVASQDPGVPPNDPQDVAAARLAANASSMADIAEVIAAHTKWWDDFWSASEVMLDEEAATAEAFWYGSLYALGASSRAGQIAPDLFSPFRTSDYQGWRSCYTTDYNMQATFWAAFSANHAELALPYFDLLTAQLEYGGPYRDSAALGCPGGIHLSVDIAPWGRRMGIDYGPANGTSVPFDWGIHANAIFAALNYVTYYEFTQNVTFVNDTAWPFLIGAIEYWRCTLVKTPVPGAPDGYEYWDLDDCAGDESCRVPAPQRVNSVWTLTYLRRALVHVLELAPVLGRPVDPSWSDILTHLPGIQTTMYARNSSTPAVPILAWYSSNWTLWTRQSDDVMPLFPGNLLSVSNSNATLLQAALNTFEFTPWTQSNSFCWLYAAAAHAGYNPNTTLTQYQSLLKSVMHTNYLASFGGACSDSLGASQYVPDALVQGQEGFVRLFPAWPVHLDAAFTTLRVKGALLVSAAYNGSLQAVVNASVISLFGHPVSLINPWPAALPGNVTVCDGGLPSALQVARTPVNVRWSPAPGTQQPPQALMTWDTLPGNVYVVMLM